MVAAYDRGSVTLDCNDPVDRSQSYIFAGPEDALQYHAGATRISLRYYYVCHALLQNRKQEAGSVARLPAPGVEQLVLDSVRAHLRSLELPIDGVDRDLIERHVRSREPQTPPVRSQIATACVSGTRLQSLTLGNRVRSHTRGNRTAETAPGGWGARIRTWEWRNQNPLPYHLATPQSAPTILARAGQINRQAIFA
jgi:hypothetical protein